MNMFNYLVKSMCFALLGCTMQLAHAQWPEVTIQSFVLQQPSPPQPITVHLDPVYQSSKNYAVYPLKDLIKLLEPEYTENLSDSVLVFTAEDGYKVAMTHADAKLQAGYIALQDLDAESGKWIDFKFGGHIMNPGPYYLVWPAKDIDKWRFPWPFQLATVSIQPARVYYGSAAPAADAAKNIQNGFFAFSRYCIRCHSINGNGGTVGPELNRPHNVTTLYADKYLFDFIANAPKFRPSTKMPRFSKLLDQEQIRNIIAYLKTIQLKTGDEVQ